MRFENTLGFAQQMDAEDRLKDFRKQFSFPQHQGKNCLYFTGNSLGLKPAGAEEALQRELEDWGKLGVEGHFEAKNPWYSYHEPFMAPLAKIMGAEPNEVVPMNGLTANLHFLMVSFYRPEKTRTKILCEAKAFPSDLYALKSQLVHHGLDPEEHLIALEPRAGEHCLRTEDIVDAIAQAGDTLALVMMGGVNFYTGQFFDIPTITNKAHEVGALAGWDLAHAAGNVPLELHNWNVDFAAWCSYKYMNSGPGSVAGIFVHARHGNDASIPRFAGWWGHDKATRFKMESDFKPMLGAEGWQVSNAPVFSMAAHRAALHWFEEAGMTALRKKSLQLTAYLAFVLDEIGGEFADTNFEVITPKDPAQRGCQLSVLLHGQGRALFDFLSENGVVVDWREPNVIRMAPVPLYNSFEDVYRFGEVLRRGIENVKK